MADWRYVYSIISRHFIRFSFAPPLKRAHALEMILEPLIVNGASAGNARNERVKRAAAPMIGTIMRGRLACRSLLCAVFDYCHFTRKGMGKAIWLASSSCGFIFTETYHY